MATKKVMVTLAVEVEYNDEEMAYPDIQENLKGRLDAFYAFLYPSGMEVTKVETVRFDKIVRF